MPKQLLATVIAALAFTAACAAPAPNPAAASTAVTTAAPEPSPTPGVTPRLTCVRDSPSPPMVTIETSAGDDVVGFVAANDFCHGVLATPAWDPVAEDLAADAINVAITAPDGPVFVAWHVEAQESSPAIAPSASGQLHVLADGIDATGVETISFAGPPPGYWMLSARLTYPGELGSATYAWFVRAP